ncbi:hypothetical protein R3Q06_23035 [Rhodococcus erythropolis]|uniref:hypothetical protein n=1 Tax=Rhodococcus erythropolis TaxID=1833 RepID=UPI0029493F24|nr:hypothetical protein [Rhodococcus erythropolis]MDV6276378.1 hypothetical protein [Rhodococcus erythropolis]
MVSVADQIAAQWFVWSVSVQRHAGEGPYGPAHEPAVTVLGKITTKRKLVKAADGSEVISEARVSMHVNTLTIPVGSLVTFPPEFGGRTAEVLAEQRHHDGNGSTPNFYSIDLT